MTRDEAISIIKNVSYRSVAADLKKRLRDDVVESAMDEMAADDVDSLVALGILKLDEPKSAIDKFCDAMISRGYVPNSVVWSDILPALEAAGLKIVEK